jgi:cell division protein FtsL
MWERGGHKRQAVREPVVYKENRYVFNGESRASVTGYAVRQNRRTVRRKFSTFNVILAVFGLGVLIVLYVHNIIVVNRLVVEINTLQEQIQEQVKANSELHADVSRKASLERIGTVASEKLGMQYPHEQPTWLPIDPDLHDRAEQVRSEAGE